MSSETLDDAIRNPVKASRMAEALRTLGHPLRLRVMACLASRGEATVGDIGRELGLPQAVVSQQLQRLRLGGQVRVRAQGGFRYYSLMTTEVVELLSCLARCCDATSKRLQGE